MTDTSVHLPVAAQESLASLVEVGVRAERHGYHRAWVPETWGRDAVTALALLGERTGEIGVGSSVFNVYSRSPALIGQTAATLQEASGGRFRVGLGPSGPRVVEGWHGASFEAPLRRTREAVEVVRAALAGERVEYDGSVFSLDGFRLRCEPPATPPPIDVAGMGPKAVELAGRFADGWHALMFTPDGLRARAADLERGCDLAGRDPGDVRVTLVVPCAVADDGERARERLRRHVAFYVGGMGTFYRDALARQGHGEAHDVYEAWQSGDRGRAAGAIGDGLLDALGAAGTPGEARAALDRFRSIDPVDEVAVAFPRGAAPGEIRETAAALAPA